MQVASFKDLHDMKETEIYYIYYIYYIYIYIYIYLPTSWTGGDVHIILCDIIYV